MNELSLLQEIEAEGIRLAVTDRGTIEAAGLDDALERWTPVIRRHKPELLDLLTTWAELERAVHECCDARGDSDENRTALLADCRNESAADWAWFTWYFRQEAARWTH